MNEERNEAVKSRRPLVVRGLALLLAVLMILEIGLFNASSIRFLRENYAKSDYETVADYLYENDEYLTADRLQRMRSVLRLLGSPDTFDEYSLAASVAIADEKYAEAADYTEKCIELFEGDDSALSSLYLRLGCLYGLQSDWTAARGAFVQAKDLDGQSSSAWLMLAEAELRTGDYAAALEAMEVYGRMETLNAAQLGAVGTMQLQLDMAQEAVESYTAALALEDADRAELLYQRAQAYASLGETEKALADARAYVEAGGSEEEVVALEAVAYESLGDYAGALHCYLEVIDKGATEPDIYELAVERAYLSGEYETLLELCEKAQALEAEPEALLPFLKWKGIARLELENYEEALTLLTAYIEQAGAEPEVLYLRGLAHMGGEHYRSAIEDFNAAMASEQLKDKCLYNRALCWLFRDNTSEAAEDFSEILERNADPEAVAMTRALLNLDEASA